MPSSDPVLALVLQARRLVALTNRQLGELIGVSERTVIRHADTGGPFMPAHYEALLRAVHPRDRALAQQLAAATHHDLIAMGLERPAPVVPPEPPRPPTKPEHADAVVYAAADALRLPPSDARPAVAAVFARARELGLDLHGLSALFAAEHKPRPAKG